jgi:hypothetical protein
MWNRWSNDSTAKITAVVAVPAAWLAIALYDLRFLFLIPIAWVVARVQQRVRNRYAPPAPSDDDFVL